MCQHSWYNKNRRHYGPKPNTKRARGIPFNNGKKIIKGCNTTPETLSNVEHEEVAPVKIPSDAVLAKYARVYNNYVRLYDKYRDEETARDEIAKKFELTQVYITKAIKTCKYILYATSHNP